MVLEPLDLARQVLGQQVERHPALGRHVGGHLGPALVAGVLGLLLQLVDGGALLVDHLVEGLGDPVHLGVGAALLQQLLAPLAHALDHLAHAHDPFAVAGPHPAAHEPAQRVVQVAARQQVVGELGQQVVGVEVAPLLGAVPVACSRSGPSRARSSPSPAVEGPGARGVLVEPLGQMQPLQAGTRGRRP